MSADYYFKFRYGWAEALRYLRPEAVAMIIDAAYHLASTGQTVEVPEECKPVWAIVMTELLLDNNDRTNGKKGGRPKKANDETPVSENKTPVSENKRGVGYTENSNSIEKNSKSTETETRFNAFWAAYPKKEDKKNAKKAFEKISPDHDLLQKMLAAIDRQSHSRQWKDPQYIPLPSTWLNGQRWEDQTTAESETATQTGNPYDKILQKVEGYKNDSRGNVAGIEDKGKPLAICGQGGY